jgi:hypothetical protein
MKELEVNKVLPVINANFEEVKESLNQSLEKYKGIVVTEETLQDCKKTQQDLGKVEKGIEDFRKSVKKDMEAPIKEFEAKCKELTALIGEVKKPIKDGIVIYDNKRKEEKKKQAEEIINECIVSMELSKKYSIQLTVLDKYTNLSASKKSIVEDVQARGQALKHQQDSEEKEIENTKASIDAFVDSINEDINSKLKANDYYKYVAGGNITRIMEIIKREHDKVKLAENPPKVEAKEELKQASIQEKVSVPVDLKSQQPVKQQEEKLYFYDLKVIANKDNMLRLHELIKSEGFKFEVVNQGVVSK